MENCDVLKLLKFADGSGGRLSCNVDWNISNSLEVSNHVDRNWRECYSLLQFSKSFKPLVNKTGMLCIPWLRTRAQQNVLKTGILVLPVVSFFITSILS